MTRAARCASLLLIAAIPLGGCATKRDLKEVRDEMVALQMRQDTLLVLLQRQHRELRDSIFEAAGEVARTRGELRNQLIGIEQQLIQIQELTGQSQRRLEALREEAQRREQGLDTGERAPGPVTGGRDAPVEGGGDAEELYQAGSEQLQRGATETARLAFEQLLRDFPDHPRAPDAQFGVAESYYREQRHEEALRALDRLVQLYPDSPRAPGALYRAGVIAEERGNISQARGYFQRVVSGYPRSEEARLADQKLQTRR